MVIPQELLQNKNIALAVSGSIAAYKSLELVRLLTKAGANVRVIMSQSAQKFVSKLSFESLSSNQVLDDTNESWHTDHNHIGIGKWADLLVIAPCTANTIAKLSFGIADTILLQSALAYDGKKIVAPSANTNMLHNPISDENIQKLLAANYDIIGTQIKELACKTIGDGAMAEPIEIFWACARSLLSQPFWNNRKVLITGGGTIEKIDDVRYISNFSSGKMASALASALYCLGANVTLIATKYEQEIPKKITLQTILSSKDLHEKLQKELSLCNNEKLESFVFMAAAVSDYTPTKMHNGKLKKEQLGDNFSLQLNKNIDILSSVDKSHVKTIGFKAEMDHNEAKNNASKMLIAKDLDAVCLNVLHDASSFGSENNEVEFITHSASKLLKNNNKFNISLAISQCCKELI